MKKLNSLILNNTVNFLDFIYSGRSLQRFWVLEVIARSPYFAFLSVLHFKESLGIKNEKTMILMKEHFYQAINETEHLKKWRKEEEIGSGLIDFLRDTLCLSITGSWFFIISSLQLMLMICLLYTSPSPRDLH